MFPQNLISWSKVPVCSLKTLTLMDLYEQYKESFEQFLKKKYGDINTGLIVCGDDYPLEAAITRRCLKLISSSIDAPFLAAPEPPARNYRNRIPQLGGEFWPPGEPSLKLYPSFRRVVYRIVKEESRSLGYNTVWAMVPPVEGIDEALLELMRAAIRITRRE